MANEFNAIDYLRIAGVKALPQKAKDPTNERRNFLYEYIDKNLEGSVYDGEMTQDEILKLAQEIDSINGAKKADFRITIDEIDLWKTKFCEKGQATLGDSKLILEEVERLLKSFGIATRKLQVQNTSDTYFDSVMAKDSRLKKNDNGTFSVTIEAWGSNPGNGLKANDCMSRVIANYYPEVQLYSEEYNRLSEQIVQLNNLSYYNGSPLLITGKELILPPRNQGGSVTQTNSQTQQTATNANTNTNVTQSAQSNVPLNNNNANNTNNAEEQNTQVGTETETTTETNTEAEEDDDVVLFKRALDNLRTGVILIKPEVEAIEVNLSKLSPEDISLFKNRQTI